MTRQTPEDHRQPSSRVAAPRGSSPGSQGDAVPPRPNGSPGTIELVRAMLLAVFAFGVVGAGIELILLEHIEDTFQWIPLILMGFGLVVVVWCAVRPTPAGVRTMQVLMVLFVTSGFVGLFLHYRGNVEFELEMYPSMAGMELFWESMRGATPTLSPGTMVVLGLIGWVYTFRHPATVKRDRDG